MTDDQLSKRLLVVAGISGALGIIMGAFGAHGLDSFLIGRGMDEAIVPKRIDQFETASRYHLIHTVVLLTLASISHTPRLKKIVAGLFVGGIFLFSGSLYALVLSNTPVLGAVTPIGGLLWIAGWLGLLLSTRA